jgi:16S rRNA (guanine527-N7)-methyltransferase
MRSSANPMTPQAIRQILESYHSPLPIGIEAKAQKYMELMGFWGRKISLTTVREPEEIVRFHFGESIFALSVVKFEESRLADVGTGAGFPGLALKLAVPELQITLIEPNKKKCAFLHEIVRALGLNGVTIAPSTYESSGIAKNSLSIISCRALGLDKRFLSWSREILNPRGVLLLWVGYGDSEKIRGTEKGWSWGEPQLIPESTGRYILAGTPIRP